MAARFDLHIHSSFSDGTDTPEELFGYARAAGLGVFAICDHDTITGAMNMLEVLEELPSEPDAPIFIPGIEISSISSAGKHHLLGLGYDPSSPVIHDLSDRMHGLRNRKFQERLAYLEKVHGVVFPPDELAWLDTIPSVGKPHLAQVLMRMGLASSIPDASEKYIDRCKTSSTRIDAAEAIAAVHAASGLVLWAHPLGGEEDIRLSAEEFLEQLDVLQALGLDGLECHYSRYSAEECALLVNTAQERGLLMSGGSDYHGHIKDVALGQLGIDYPDVSRSALTVLDALGI